ncbi:MAG: hypothetical protein M1829_001609 [Trizodia sp. TS-e1964]|nr:MAG: hypothetical protein M1829_001609 [Trizodia sp. TS-e1964]
MSGAEIIAVLGGIGAILEISKTISEVYTTFKDLQGLPKAFSLVARRLPLVNDILESVKRHVEAEGNEVVCRTIMPIVEHSETNIKTIEEIFEKLKPGDGAKKLERYIKAVKARGKGSKVENLMANVFKDVQLLNLQRGMNTTTHEQQAEVLAAIQELADVPPSVPDSEFHEHGLTMSQSGSGTQQYVATGDAFSSGGGKIYSAQQQIFVNEKYTKDDEDSCLCALFLTDPSIDRDKLVNAKGSRVNGTCEWIKTNVLYDLWLRSHSQLLWLSGGPGMGKSMIAIFLAEELEMMAKDSQYTCFLQYFCDNKDEKRNTAVSVLRGLIFQILKLQPKLIHHILPSFKVQMESLFSSSSFETLWRIFQSIICEPIIGAIYCVLDGLDECDEASLEVLLNKFAALLLTQSNKAPICQLHLIILSRDLPELVPYLLSSFPRIRLDPDAKTEVNGDIHRFIDLKVDELSRRRGYPAQLSVYVKEVFQRRAQGTFLWIGIVAKSLERYKLTEVERALDLFPPGLDGLYARILLQIDIDRREMAARILRWVVVAFRPLTLSELRIAVGATKGLSVNISWEKLMRDLVSYCGYFLTIKENEVNLIHQSAKDYLLRKTPDSNPELEIFRVKEEAANLEIARKCFCYLQDGALAAGPVAIKTNAPYLELFPMLSYAVLNWPGHSKALPRSEDIFDLSLPFYNKKSAVRDSWLLTYWTSEGLWGSPLSLTLLHLASFFGILPLAENLLEESCLIDKTKLLLFINKLDNRGTTALIWAARGGHEAIVQLLLDKGANTEANDIYGGTALICAARGGHEAIVQLLLDKGANTEAKDDRKATALIRAARGGHEAIVQLLLDKGANTEANDIYGGTALICAARGGHEAIVQLLLDKGANIEAEDNTGDTALSTAALEGNETIVQLLLEKGANTEANDNYGGTALICAARGGHETIVQLLLDKGANTEAKDIYGATVLICAARGGQDAIVQLLLDKGANTEAKDNIGRTSLILAAKMEHTAVVQLLLEKGADIEAQDNFGKTARERAAEGKHEAAVRMLDNYKTK